MTRLVKNTQSRDQFTDGPCPLWTVGDKNETSPLNDTPHSLSPVPWNILHVTQGVLCSSCNRKFICCEKKYSFIYRKNVLWHKVFFFGQSESSCPYKSFFLSICPSVCLSYLAFRETFEISLCHTSMTWFLFLSQEINFLSQDIFFLSQEKILLLQIIILLLLQEVFFLLPEGLFVTWVNFVMWHEIFLLLQGVLCASHEGYFRSQE